MYSTLWRYRANSLLRELRSGPCCMGRSVFLGELVTYVFCRATSGVRKGNQEQGLLQALPGQVPPQKRYASARQTKGPRALVFMISVGLAFATEMLWAFQVVLLMRSVYLRCRCVCPSCRGQDRLPRTSTPDSAGQEQVFHTKVPPGGALHA